MMKRVLTNELPILVLVVLAMGLLGYAIMSTHWLDLDPATSTPLYSPEQMLVGLQRFFIGLGLALGLTAVGFIWLGKREDVATTFDSPK